MPRLLPALLPLSIVTVSLSLTGCSNDATNADDPGGWEPMTFEEYREFVSEYTLDYAHELSGVPKNRLEELAALYADPQTRVMSLWTMGFNQHTRGCGATTCSTTSIC